MKDVKRPCEKLKGALEHVIGEEVPETANGSDLGRWQDLLMAVMTLFTQLRTSLSPIYVQDPRSKVPEYTLGELLREKPDLPFALRSKGPTFTESEKCCMEEMSIFSLLGLVEAKYEDMGGYQCVRNHAQDVYAYIGDKYRELVPLPDISEMPAKVPTPTKKTSTEPAAQTGELYHPLLVNVAKDLNSKSDFVQQAKRGGITEKAQAAYGELSAKKKMAFLRDFEGKFSLEDAKTEVAAKYDWEEEVALEILIYRLLLSKNAFRVNRFTGIVERV